MMRAQWYRVGLPVLAVAVLCCKPKQSESGMAAADPVVMIGRENVAIADLAELRSGPAISGSLEPRVAATVRAEIMGPVERAYVDEGQQVKRGALLARINDTSVRDTYLSARSAVRTAESGLQNARRNAERATRLAQAGALADRDLEAAVQSQTTAEGALADAQARLASAQKQLGNTEAFQPSPYGDARRGGFPRQAVREHDPFAVTTLLCNHGCILGVRTGTANCQVRLGHLPFLASCSRNGWVSAAET